MHVSGLLRRVGAKTAGRATAPAGKALVLASLACAALMSLAACGGSKHEAAKSPTATSAASTSAAPTPSPAPKTLPSLSTPVSAPGGGDVRSTIASASVHTAAPIPVTATADFGTGVTTKVVSNKKISFSAHLPGEISGPAAQVTLQFTNNSAAAVSLSHVVVNDQDAKGTPMVSNQSSPAAPVTGSLAPGASTTGVYVFSLTSSYVAPLTISVSYSTAAPVVLFVGDVS